MARKGESIFHRKDGRWEARYVKGYRPDGTCQYGFLYGKSYGEVKKKRTEILLKLNQHGRGQKQENEKKKEFQETILFQDKIKEWLMSQKPSVKESTYTYYYHVTQNHIKPLLGKLTLNQISDKVITDFTNYKMNHSNLKMSTLKEIVIVLRQILSFCHITTQVKLPKVTKQKIQIISKEDKEKLEHYLFSHLNEISIGILLSLYTGLRIGEVCALQWKDINFENETISIQKTVSRVRNFELTQKKTKLLLMDAKTEHSIREIPLHKSFLSLLKEMSAGKKDTYFILTSSYKMMDPRNYYNQYQKIIKKCHIAHYKYHSLRHTFATNCIELGLDPKSLSELLGHSDIKITLSLYVHPSLERKKEFINQRLNIPQLF